VTHQRFTSAGGDASVGDLKEVDDNGQAQTKRAAEQSVVGCGGLPIRTIRVHYGGNRRCTWCGASATRLARLQRWQR
jgi:hypothetical protein